MPTTEPSELARDAEAAFAAPLGSASPVTDDAWDAYNRKTCGLHYIAHKMREIETDARSLKAELSKSLDREAALKDALSLARQYIAGEFGFENWRIEKVDELAKTPNRGVGE